MSSNRKLYLLSFFGFDKLIATFIKTYIPCFLFYTARHFCFTQYMYMIIAYLATGRCEGVKSQQVCDCIIYTLSLVYAAINSVYTLGKVFPKHHRVGLSAYPLSILLYLDIVPTSTYLNIQCELTEVLPSFPFYIHFSALCSFIINLLSFLLFVLRNQIL